MIPDVDEFNEKEEKLNSSLLKNYCGKCIFINKIYNISAYP